VRPGLPSAGAAASEADDTEATALTLAESAMERWKTLVAAAGLPTLYGPTA
jgi:hypothetical protein